MRTKTLYPKIAGVLFLVAFIGAFSAPILSKLNVSTNLALDFAENKDSVLRASVGLMIMGFACAAIPVALYPILREKHPTSAIGSVVFRGIEGVFHLLISICYILMSVVAQKFSTAEAEPLLQVMLESIRTYVFVATIAWGIGAILYYYPLFKTKMLPCVITVWGLVAMPLALVGASLVFFLKMDSSAPVALVLNIPIALQEIAFAIWLIIKGVKQTSNNR